MKELKAPLVKTTSENGAECYVITEQHSIADVIRHCIAESGIEDVSDVLADMQEELIEAKVIEAESALKKLIEAMSSDLFVDIGVQISGVEINIQPLGAFGSIDRSFAITKLNITTDKG